MARIRSVHPSLWTDENFVSMTMAARLFLIGLWNEADDYGLFEWKPVTLKMRLSPADNVDPEELLEEIFSKGFITHYDYKNKRLGVIANFRKYQRPQKPSAPLVPITLHIAELINLGDSKVPTEHLSEDYDSPTGICPQMEDGVGVGEERKKEGGDKRPSPRGTRLPDDWTPSRQNREYAASNRGWDPPRIEQVAEDFRDYWISQPGQKGVKTNWDATWQRWVRNQHEPASQSRKPTVKSSPSYADIAADIANGAAENGSGGGWTVDAETVEGTWGGQGFSGTTGQLEVLASSNGLRTVRQGTG